MRRPHPHYKHTDRHSTGGGASSSLTNYRQWLGSEYLTNQIALDPAVTQRRLGDGFYEQKLIREQIAQLTGQRFLGDYTSDQDQYRALMNGAVTYAKANNLRPGIALTAEQMARLTADIVWLVEQDVVIPNQFNPDGTPKTTKALVPQVYLRLREGDLATNGALLAGKNIDLNLKGDLTNSGTIAGRQVTRITAENLNNLDGRIAGDTVKATARNDLNNIGGTIAANSALFVSAGRDINVTTTVNSTNNSTANRSGNNNANRFSQTSVDRVAGLYVANPNGILAASAGRDLNLTGAIVANAGAGSRTQLQAVHDINIGAVETKRAEHIDFGANRAGNNTLDQSSSTHIGSQVQAGGNLTMTAGNATSEGDINITGSTVHAVGNLKASATGNVSVVNTNDTLDYRQESSTRTRNLTSSTSRNTVNTIERSTVVGSSLTAGGSVNVHADQTAYVQGSTIAGQQGTRLDADQGVWIEAAYNVDSTSNSSSTRRSGFMPSLSSSGLTIDLKRQNTATNASTTSTAVLSVIGSNNSVSANNTSITSTQGEVNVRGADLLAGANSTLTISGTEVDLRGAISQTDTSQSEAHKRTNFGTSVVKLGEGFQARGNSSASTSTQTLAPTTLSAGNVSITATGQGMGAHDGDISLSGVQINTNQLAFNALGTNGDTSKPTGTVNFNLATTTNSSQTDNFKRDLVYQVAHGSGNTTDTAHFNQLNVNPANISYTAGAVNVQTPNTATPSQSTSSTQATLSTLAAQPGMAYLTPLLNGTAVDSAGKPITVNWQQIELTLDSWDYKQQGLTPEGAAIVAIVATYFTAGAASGAAASMLGTATGMSATAAAAAYPALAAAMSAGLSTLATQASIALINHQGNLAAALKELGSQASVKQLLTAMVTAGAVQGVTSLLPAEIQQATTGSASFTNQLARNLVTGVASTLVTTAINGGKLEDALKQTLISAFISTGAAQGANAIGNTFATLDPTLVNNFAHKLAHALAGCVAGAASTASSAGGNSSSAAGGGCAAGALGAVVGELTAELLNSNNNNNNPTGAPNPDTLALARLMGGMAAAVAGGNPAQINLAANAAANAVENNNLATRAGRNAYRTAKAQMIQDCEAKPTGCTAADYQEIDGRATAIGAGAELYAMSQRTSLTPEQYQRLGENLALLAPFYGTGFALYQAITGRTATTDEELTKAERFFSLVAAALPIGSAAWSAAKAAANSVTVQYSLSLFAAPVGVANGMRTVTSIEQALLGSGGAIPSVSGNVAAAAVRVEGAILSDLNVAERELANRIAAGEDAIATATRPAGELTEQLFTSYARRHGMEVLEGKYGGGSNNGFDLIAKSADGTVTIILDAKQMAPGGSFSLGTTTLGGLGQAQQLSPAWINYVTNQLPIGSPARLAVELANRNGTLVTAVGGVNKATGKAVVVPIR
jgi:filamentous hemagglutinin